METLSSKLSFYDFLNILVTGFLLLNLFCGDSWDNAPSWTAVLYISLASFFIGFVYHQTIECTIGVYIRNPRKIIDNSFIAVTKSIEDNPMPDSSKKNYLQAYYLIAKNNCLMNIPILEAHIAFVRNIWFVLLLYLIAICASCPSVGILSRLFNPCVVAMGITILLIALPFIWYRLQDKVSYLVWEGAYFLQNKKENEKDNTK